MKPETSQPSASTPPPYHKQRSAPLILSCIAVVLGLGIGSYALLQHHNSNPPAKISAHAKSSEADEVPHAYEAIVSIDATGYTPAVLTVKQNTDVIFENHDGNTEGEGEAGPAHKVVQSKAAIDQEPGFGSGFIDGTKGYGHVFNSKGTFQYFDQDAPTHTGTIIVQ